MPANLPAQSGLHAARVLRARVTDIDTRRYVVEVQTEQENRIYPNVQIGSPYYHYLGEGFGSMPDIGARCLVTIPSDDTPPTITCFLDLPLMATQAEMEQESGAGAESSSSDEAQMSFAGAKPQAFPGDVWIIGRDGNFTYWRRGGTLQEGASAFCQRMYLRSRNVIRDFCENYSLSTVGIDLLFESEREADSDSADLGVRARWQVCELLDDTSASVLVEAGKLGSDIVLRLVVNDKGIGRSLGSYSEAPVEITFKKDGTVDAVLGDTTATLGSMDLTTTRDHRTTVLGHHELTARESSETIVGVKRISAATIQFAGQVVLGTSGMSVVGDMGGALQGWLASHTHNAVTGLPVPPPPEIDIPNVTG